MAIHIEYEVEILLSQILRDWDVRLHAGENDLPRVELLSGRYKDGKVKDPIEVAPPINDIYRLIEGRTRFAALLANGVKKIKVGVLSPATDEEYIAYAYCCNSEGAKPPGLEDLKVTVEMLMRRGQSEKQIKTGWLSRVESTARLKLACDQVRSNLNKQGVAKAKLMIASLRIADPDERIRVAAGACNVSVRAVKKALNQGGPTTKRNTLLNEIKKDLGGVNNTRRVWLNGKIIWIEKRYDLGTPTEQILQVYDHMIGQLRGNLKLYEDAKERFEIRVNGGATKATKARAAAVGE